MIKNKIIGIIFSRDRAMQLDAVLRSFFLHCVDSDLIKISVLYMVTDENHAGQYQKLMEEYPHVIFIKQTNFFKDVLIWQNPYVPGKSAYKKYISLIEMNFNHFFKYFNRVRKYLKQKILKYLLPKISRKFYLFLVDDNLFVRDFSLSHVTNMLIDQPRALGFSLRLGMNTNYCYSHDSVQALPDFRKLPGNTLLYDWISAEFDFGYPLEISSSVYRAQDIVPLLFSLEFYNPNTLEAEMAAQAKTFKVNFPLMLCYEKSVTFCNPINLVQTTYQNRSGGECNYSIAEMVERFDRGERINVVEYSEFIPNACHQEVMLNFEEIMISKG